MLDHIPHSQLVVAYNIAGSCIHTFSRQLYPYLQQAAVSSRQLYPYLVDGSCSQLYPYLVAGMCCFIIRIQLCTVIIRGYKQESYGFKLRRDCILKRLGFILADKILLHITLTVLFRNQTLNQSLIHNLCMLRYSDSQSVSSHLFQLVRNKQQQTNTMYRSPFCPIPQVMH